MRSISGGGPISPHAPPPTRIAFGSPTSPQGGGNGFLALMRESRAMLQRLVLLIFALCLAYPAFGAEGASKRKKPEPGTSVEMPFLVAPMTEGGNLLGYSYISSRLLCSSPSACIAVREKLAFIQDAFVRDVNLKPVSPASDPKEVDRDLLNIRLTAAARRVIGADKVRGMAFEEIKFTPLHADDSTANVPPPEQTPADAAGKGGGKDQESGKTAASQGATSKPAAKQSQ
jgi:hypothetical protein